jgi:hypothetical protein
MLASVCDCEENDFSARASQENGRRMLRVEGSCMCPRAGYALALEPGNPGVNPDPAEVVLQLVVTPPEFGPDVMTRTPVRYEAAITPEAERVVVRIPDQKGLMIPIRGGGDAYGGASG